MQIAEFFGVKNVKLQLRGDYPTIQTLFTRIHDIPFQAGPPQLLHHGTTERIAFPELDSNNQVQIVGTKGKYTVIRTTQPLKLDKMAMNLALTNRMDSWSGVSGAYGSTKALCMTLVESTASAILHAEL